MSDNKLLEGLEYIDADLIEAADQIPHKGKKTPATYMYGIVLGLAAVAAIVLLSFLWKGHGANTQSDIHMGGLKTTTAYQAPSQNSQQETTSNTKQEARPTTPAYPDSTHFLTLDVNPSVQFAVQEGLVIDCIALNDDGERILTGLDLAGMTMEEALPKVLEELIQQGYLATKDHAPVMLYSARGDENAQELLHIAAVTTQNTLTEQKIETFIVTQEIDNAENVIRLAELYGVSVGKMQYVLNILQKEAEISLEEASDMSIIELFGLDIEKRLIEPPYKVGDYDEYGEKVLFVGSVESYVGYVPWGELSEEYKNELSQIYTPEALAILSMPRVWSTMPNVVGLPADEALNLLYSRNIAPCIGYEDSAMAREEGYTDGTCFMQDTPQGWRTNSDACVHIWILISEGDKNK